MANCNLVERIRSRETPSSGTAVPSYSSFSGRVCKDQSIAQPMLTALGRPLPLPYFSQDKETIIDMIYDHSTNVSCGDQHDTRPFKYVLHTKEEGSYLPPENWPGIYGTVPWVDARPLICYWGSLPETTGISTLRGYAANPFTPPDVSSGVSENDLILAFQDLTVLRNIDGVELPNFIIELRELKRLAALRPTKSELRKAGGLIRDVGSKYLGVVFGVVPLISDLMRLNDLQRQLDEFLHRWNQACEEGKLLVLHGTAYDRTDVVDISHSLTTSTHYTLSGEFKTHSLAKVHVYIRPLPVPRTASRDLAKKALGFTNPAAVLWEAMPFSWLIDYFFELDKFIDMFDSYESPFKYRIVDAGYSVKTTQSQVITGVVDYDNTYVPDIPDPVVVYNDGALGIALQKRTTYIRQPLDPARVRQLQAKDADVEYFSTDLTTGQSLILTALAMTYSPRR